MTAAQDFTRWRRFALAPDPDFNPHRGSRTTSSSTTKVPCVGEPWPAVFAIPPRELVSQPKPHAQSTLNPLLP